MTENTEKAAGVEPPQLAEPQSNPPEQESLTRAEVPPIKVKSERPDAEVEAKLRALNAKIKADTLAQQRRSNSKEQGDETDGSDSSSSEENKKDIAPVKSSNEILAELFGVFNAAPPEELLDDKNLLKKKKKVKKEKKEKKAKKKKASKSDGECSDSEAEGKHKHKRKKHKHKHKDGKIKDRDKSKEKDKAPPALPEKETKKSESRKRSAAESVTQAEAHPVKRERHDRHDDRDRERDREREREKEREKEREREREREREKEREREREKERVRSHNSFYNGHREAERSKESEASRTKSRQADLSDVSLSDEESYLRERESNGRRRPHNSFYDGKEEHPKVSPKRSPKRSARESTSRRNRRSRSRSRDLGIDKNRLLEIARKNAISMFKRGTLPGVANMTPEIKDKVLVKMRYGGRTVQDLTDFCKKISNGDGLSDLSSEEDSDMDKNGNAKAFHHPFQLKEREPIVMHIRNSTALVPAPTRVDDQAKAITMQFPVSSGQTHRNNEVWVPVERKDALVPLPSLPPAKQATNMFKETPKNVFAKSMPPQEQQQPAFKSVGGAVLVPPAAAVPSLNVPQPVPPPISKEPVPPTPATPFVPEVPIPSTTPTTPAPSASIFPEVTPPSMDVSSIITQRLSAIRRLQDNPADSEALKMMYNAQRNMSSWANSKHLPGQFTGSTGAQVMKAHELSSGPQLWVRKDQLTSTKPVTGGMGMALLQKMGWKPGEGLGRCKTGSLQPLLLDVKLDKRGLVSREDLKPPPSRQSAAQRRNKNASGPVGGGGPPGTGAVGGGPPVTGAAAPLVTQDKHPVCVLNELTSKNKWTPPQYKLRQDIGPAHNRSFLFSVEINGMTYTPERGCNNKKEAKLNAAALCLRALGILPPS
ncbi:protein Son [Drosophila biarmipes]|uniref:protein Son n=1 Tax=Drosophila biarmipes TaxID=125945 RepID=UPI001CDAEB24|nr:protein Son [Drosophila biarmipes]